MPVSILKNARCIAVIPNVTTDALVVAGAHGDGLASCRDSTDAWSQPAEIFWNQVSIRLQVGAASADLVLFFESKDTDQDLKRGEFDLGADVSAVAGKFDSNLDMAKAGLVVYARTEGFSRGHRSMVVRWV